MDTRMFSGRHQSSQPSPQASVSRSPSTARCHPATSQHHALANPLDIPDVSHLQPSEQDKIFRQQAIRAAQQGQHAKAIALLNLLLDRNPNNASDYNNRGLIYFQSGHLEKALADYNRSLWLNPKQTKVYNNRANCYAALGRLAEAITDYEMAIDLDPANVRAWVNQGITFRDLEMYDEAVENFDLALQVNEIVNNADRMGVNLVLQGHIYAERGRTHHLAGDWNCAVADYYRALDSLPLTKIPAAPNSCRLRLQVDAWLDDLLEPLMQG
jgi:Tfp pilus assembly protein PilF